LAERLILVSHQNLWKKRGIVSAVIQDYIQDSLTSIGESFMYMNNNNTIQLQEAITKYIKWKGSHIDSSISRYLPIMEKFKAFVGNIELSELTGDEIIDFDIEMINKGYSSAYRALILRVIRNFLYFWQGRSQVHFSPKEIIAPKILNPNRVVVELNDFEEMKTVLDENDVNDLQKLVAIHLLYDTGVRVSELLKLRIEDIQKLSDGTWAAPIRTRKVTLYDLVLWGIETNRLLNKYLAYKLTVRDDHSEYIFTSLNLKKRGNHITPRTVQRWVRGIRELALIDKMITPHSFRHGKGHFILNNGGGLIDVQKILRHKNIQSTLHYTRMNPTKYLQRASKFVNQSQKIPIHFVESKTEMVEVKIAENSKMTYNII